MARKTNKTSGRDDAPASKLPGEKVEDAVVVSDVPGETEAEISSESSSEPIADDTVSAGEPREAAGEESAEIEGGEGQATADVEDDPSADPVASDPLLMSAEDAPTNEQTTSAIPDTAGIEEQEDRRAEDGEQSAVAVVPPAQTINRGPGFLPLLLGGLIAGAIGYAVAMWTAPTDQVVDGGEADRIAALESDVRTLQTDFASAPQSDVDFTDIEAAQATLRDRLDGLETRLDELADQEPTTDATAPAGPAADASTAAIGPDYAPQIDGLRQDLASLSDEVADITENAANLRDDVVARVDTIEADVAQLRSRSDDVEDEAAALAREAAINQIRIALDSGSPYAEPLSVLENAPAGLAAPAETGVATAGELTAAFAEPARAALRASRGDEAGVASALGSLFNARSLQPREGTDPDAVLSRAEAAVRAGDIETVLVEIEALPEPARAELSAWVERARVRQGAQTALKDYLQDG